MGALETHHLCRRAWTFSFSVPQALCERMTWIMKAIVKIHPLPEPEVIFLELARLNRSAQMPRKLGSYVEAWSSALLRVCQSQPRRVGHKGRVHVARTPWVCGQEPVGELRCHALVAAMGHMIRIWGAKGAWSAVRNLDKVLKTLWHVTNTHIFSSERFIYLRHVICITCISSYENTFCRWK